jgi:hypothetical protein
MTSGGSPTGLLVSRCSKLIIRLLHLLYHTGTLGALRSIHEAGRQSGITGDKNLFPQFWPVAICSKRLVGKQLSTSGRERVAYTAQQMKNID